MSSRYKKVRKSTSAKPFAAIELKTVISNSWKMLNSTEAHVYNTLKTFYKGQNQWFTAPFTELKKRTRIKHAQTISIALSQLETKGWIEIKRYAKHRKGRGLRVKSNEYLLTKKYDYLRW